MALITVFAILSLLYCLYFVKPVLFLLYGTLIISAMWDFVCFYFVGSWFLPWYKILVAFVLWDCGYFQNIGYWLLLFYETLISIAILLLDISSFEVCTNSNSIIAWNTIDFQLNHIVLLYMMRFLSLKQKSLITINASGISIRFGNSDKKVYKILQN